MYLRTALNFYFPNFSFSNVGRTGMPTSEVVLMLSACSLPLSPATPGASNAEAHKAES